MLQGMLDWPRLLPAICGHGVWFFKVPIGDSGVATHYTQPQYPLQLAANHCMSPGSTAGTHLAKILVYALRADAADEAGASSELAAGEEAGGNGNGNGNGHAHGGGEERTEALTAVQAIRRFCLLLEHYFHANTGGTHLKNEPSCLQAPSLYAQNANALPALCMAARARQRRA
jgi:hypothetical protein